MRPIIRLGDPTSHGGAVVSVAAANHTVDGIPVARVGDLCSCPKKGHGPCTIVEGDPHYTVDGVPVAFEGHKTSCGASLIATIGHFARD